MEDLPAAVGEREREQGGGPEDAVVEAGEFGGGRGVLQRLQQLGELRALLAAEEFGDRRQLLHEGDDAAGSGHGVFGACGDWRLLLHGVRGRVLRGCVSLPDRADHRRVLLRALPAVRDREYAERRV